MQFCFGVLSSIDHSEYLQLQVYCVDYGFIEHVMPEH